MLRAVFAVALFAPVTTVASAIDAKVERMKQDAQVQLDQKQQELLATFQNKVLPIVEAIRNEKGLWMIFQIGVDNSPIVAAHAGLDLTAEVIKRLDSAK